MKRQILRSREYLDAGFPLVVVEVEQTPHAEHAHDFYEMVYIRRGRGTHILEGVPYPIRAGDFYFLRPGEAHSYIPDGSLKIINVLWQPSLVSEVLRSSFSGENAQSVLAYIEPLLKPRPKSKTKPDTFRPRLHLEGGAAFRVENLLDEMRREISAAQGGAPAPGCHILLRHLFCALLVLLARASQQNQQQRRALASRPSQNLVACAIEYLEIHHAQSVRVHDVAAFVALSPGRFAHVFKEATGRSPIEYLHELRLEKVCAALRGSTLPIQEIAASFGYNDLRFFHRVFRRHAGCNPTQYRAQFGPE